MFAANGRPLEMGASTAAKIGTVSVELVEGRFCKLRFK